MSDHKIIKTIKRHGDLLFCYNILTLKSSKDSICYIVLACETIIHALDL